MLVSLRSPAVLAALFPGCFHSAVVSIQPKAVFYALAADEFIVADCGTVCPDLIDWYRMSMVSEGRL